MKKFNNIDSQAVCINFLILLVILGKFYYNNYCSEEYI